MRARRWSKCMCFSASPVPGSSPPRRMMISSGRFANRDIRCWATAIAQACRPPRETVGWSLDRDGIGSLPGGLREHPQYEFKKHPHLSAKNRERIVVGAHSLYGVTGNRRQFSGVRPKSCEWPPE